MERQQTEGKNMFASQMSDNGLIPKYIYIELIYLNAKKKKSDL